MAQFKFPLATLLKVREAARDERRLQLAEAFEAEQILRNQRRQWEEELNALLENMRRQTGPGRVNVDQLHDSSRYALQLRAQGQLLARQEQQIAAEVERRRQLLVESDKQVRVVEKLRERKLEEFTFEEARREGARLDEVGTLQAVRHGGRP